MSRLTSRAGALIFRPVSRALAGSLALFALCCGEGPRPAPPALAPEPVGTAPLRLMPLGDSITQADSEHDPRVKILIAQLIPVASALQNESIQTLNPEIARLAARKTNESSPVALADPFTGFDVAEDTHDGVHPDLSGEVKMAQRWFTALEALSLPRRRTP